MVEVTFVTVGAVLSKISEDASGAVLVDGGSVSVEPPPIATAFHPYVPSPAVMVYASDPLTVVSLTARVHV
ncbi:MAG: hypothetical protein MUO36_00455 [Candidatus Hadarchaeum sp.]|nr:hypothetical protein [Candidatus Hadarchaeum sp.]